jgi:hypothetical protein
LASNACPLAGADCPAGAADPSSCQAVLGGVLGSLQWRPSPSSASSFAANASNSSASARNLFAATSPNSVTACMRIRCAFARRARTSSKCSGKYGLPNGMSATHHATECRDVGRCFEAGETASLQFPLTVLIKGRPAINSPRRWRVTGASAITGGSEPGRAMAVTRRAWGMGGPVADHRGGQVDRLWPSEVNRDTIERISAPDAQRDGYVPKFQPLAPAAVVGRPRASHRHRKYSQRNSRP